MLKILIAGGTGLIGSNLITKLKQKNYKIVLLSTQKSKTDNESVFYWQPYKNELPEAALEGIDICINLCGAGIFDKAFSAERKKELIDSRIISTQVLLNAFKLKNQSLLHYFGGSATGIYPNICSSILTEDSTKGDGFISDLVLQWEAASHQFSTIAKHVSIIRTGIILSEKGGFLKQLMTPVKLFAGAVPGNGKQMISWIHIDDWSNLLIHLLEHNLNGTFNATASNPATIQSLTESIAKVLHRPLILPNIPVFALKLLFGERYELLLTSQLVSNEKIKSTGFKFEYEFSTLAIQNLLSK
ncbi:MAG: TIGR01777 family oxidoreductase [bacterium]|nr:TIGR01777 family oxidoreductase [bacterium]